MALELKAIESGAVAVPTSAPVRPLFALSRIRVADRSFFTERLALMLESGVALHAALRTLGAQADNAAMGAVIDALAQDVLEGNPFSRALARHPRVFPVTYVNLVAASEQGGYLHEVLRQLVDADEKAARLRAALVAALSYPAFLIAFSVAVVVFVLVVVFPKFTDMFASIHDRLPGITLVLMAVSDLLRNYWVPLIGAAVAAVAAILAWARQPLGRAVLDRLQLRLPVVGPLMVRVHLVRCLRVLGLSLSNGVNILEALAAAREAVPNREFQALLSRVESGAAEGRGVASGFREQGFLPALVPEMLATGEETGKLALVMGRIADFYHRDLERSLATLSRLAEPVMLLVMGGVVGLIVSALILPIFRLAGAPH